MFGCHEGREQKTAFRLAVLVVSESTEHNSIIITNNKKEKQFTLLCPTSIMTIACELVQDNFTRTGIYRKEATHRIY